MKMERVFQILAVILAGIAACFLWKGSGENAFITAVLGAVSFFLSVRFQVKARLKQREDFTAETQGHGDSEKDLANDSKNEAQ